MKKANLRILATEERKDSSLKVYKHLYQNQRRKFPQPKERDGHKSTISLQNTKYIGSEKKLLLPHNNQNTKCPEQRKNTRVIFTVR